MIDSNKEITKASYQATAQQFARNVADLAPLESIKQFIKLLPQNAKIIDLGAGSGRDAKIFTQMGASVIGVDYCSNFIDIAKIHAPLANFQLQDIESMSFPENSFDGAWACCSLGHTPKNKILSVLKKIHSFLKPNAYLYLALKKGAGEILEKDTRYDGDIRKFWAYYEEAELSHLLRLASFKILELTAVAKTHAYHTHDAFKIFCQKIDS